MDKHLHIVAFDAPSPPDYGGAIDVYYKIVALAKAGVKITLHYFQYKQGRNHQGLHAYCEEVYVYNRRPYRKCLASSLPFIVASRINRTLIDKLNKDHKPILLEGLHCTGILPFLHNKERVVLRLHNNEAAYYQRLAAVEKHPFRNLYYLVESTRLERYQRSLPNNIKTAAIAQSDAGFFAANLGWEGLFFMPAFTPWSGVLSPGGSGGFYLYHGNLAVAENEAVVLWLLKHVVCKCSLPFVVAGSNASARLKQAIVQQPDARLINNPPGEVLEGLIQSAQIHLLPSLNQTGVKIKLLHVLFRGRHCVTNAAGVAGSGLNDAVVIAEDAGTMLQAIESLKQTPFDEAQKKQRQALLQLYNNEVNARALIAQVW